MVLIFFNFLKFSFFLLFFNYIYIIISPNKFKLQSWWPQALYRGFHFSQANPEMKSRSKIL